MQIVRLSFCACAAWLTGCNGDEPLDPLPPATFTPSTDTTASLKAGSPGDIVLGAMSTENRVGDLTVETALVGSHEIHVRFTDYGTSPIISRMKGTVHIDGLTTPMRLLRSPSDLFMIGRTQQQLVPPLKGSVELALPDRPPTSFDVTLHGFAPAETDYPRMQLDVSGKNASQLINDLRTLLQELEILGEPEDALKAAVRVRTAGSMAEAIASRAPQSSARAIRRPVNVIHSAATSVSLEIERGTHGYKSIVDQMKRAQEDMARMIEGEPAP